MDLSVATPGSLFSLSAMSDRDSLEYGLTVALEQIKLMSCRISFRVRRGVNLNNIGMLSVLVRDLCDIITTAEDNWVYWSMVLETDDQGDPVMPGPDER